MEASASTAQSPVCKPTQRRKQTCKQKQQNKRQSAPRQTMKGKRAKQQRKPDELNLSNTEAQIAPNNNINNQQAEDQTPNEHNNGASIPNAENQEISALNINNHQEVDQTPNAKNNGASIPNAEDQEISALNINSHQEGDETPNAQNNGASILNEEVPPSLNIQDSIPNIEAQTQNNDIAEAPAPNVQSLVHKQTHQQQQAGNRRKLSC